MQQASTTTPSGTKTVSGNNNSVKAAKTGDTTNVVGLVVLCLALIQDKELRNHMGMAAKQTILLQYTPEKITQQLIDICENNRK